MLIRTPSGSQQGITLIEVLVTIVILAFGLLGLAGLQSKLNLGMVESYQRAQAVVLLTNMTERITANRANAADYVSANTIGTMDAQPSDCSTGATQAARDLCEWSNSLKGAAETKTSGANTSNMGAMVGARGCVTQVQAPDATEGVCAPGIYQVAVAWQGVHETKAPSISCGSGQYGGETYRRAVAVEVSVALTNCK